MEHGEWRACLCYDNDGSELERSFSSPEVLLSPSIIRHFGLLRSRSERAFFPTLDQSF